MAGFEAADCTCESSPSCSGSPNCTCIWFENTRACICTCSNDPIVLKAKVASDERVVVRTRGMDLGDLAHIFSQVADTPLLVPAERIKEKVSTQYLEPTALGDLLQAYGLVPRDGSPAA
ncbi:MAG TPA: hypothetical protein VEU28_08075 [Actinomycetota bacterium]|nr:hypothetical protein [Actinomycetota bacterium]